MVASTTNIPNGSISGVRVLARRAWTSRAAMTAFYIATLAGLILVTGPGPDAFDGRPAGDPITQAARPSLSPLDAVDIAVQD